MPCEKLLEFLDQNKVRYQLESHPKAFAACDVAFKAGVARRFFAKTVMVKLNGKLAMAVIPALEKINFHLLREAASARTITLATEGEFAAMFPDCELGAMPPFGNLYGMQVFAAGTLARGKTITFNAGSFREVLTLPYLDFERLVMPKIGWFTFRQASELKGNA